MSKNNKQGNDQVIADFMKKSIIVILIIATISALIYFILQRKPDVKLVTEKAYEAPAILKTSKQPPSVKFTEESEKRGLYFTPESGAKGLRMLPETMGNGVAFIDFDKDGDQDVIFTNASNWPWDTNESSNNPTQKLYENDGSGNFKDISSTSGLNQSFYGTGIAIGDVNQDGFEDVFISAVGENALFINQNGKSFTQQEIKLDCMENAWSTSAGFFDYDQDGDLDLMILNYIQWSKELDLAADYKIDGIGRAYGPPTNFPGSHNCLFENQSKQSEIAFEDVTEASGIIVKSKTNDFEGKSLALVISDLNNDGWQDIVVANDTTRNFVFINQKDKTFLEQGEEIGLAYNSSGKATGAMGIDVSNYKNDEDLAISIGNFSNEMTSFYVNRANMDFFTDESVITGIGPQSRLALSFGLFFFDYDLDGRMDLFQTNGHVENEINKVQSAQHYAQKSQLFWNCGNDCERTYVATDKTGDIINLDIVGRAAAYADIDNDGDLDVIVTQVGLPAKLFINQLKDKKWLGLNLYENGNAVRNAKIIVEFEDSKLSIDYTSTKSYQSQVQLGKIIGLGDNNLQKIMILFNGENRILNDYKINQWNTIDLAHYNNKL
jgi:hypothetical protein